MTDYTIIKDSDGVIQSITRNKAPAASIPVCAGNSDYAQYLEDVTDGASVDEVVIPEPEITPSLQEQMDDNSDAILALAELIMG
jgi:hypothetical protein